MQYKVPQKIDLEDKIIGPLTLKQFIYLLIGGMLDYLIFSSIKSFLGWFLIFIISLVTLAFAFIQVEEQPFSYLILHLFSFLLRPKIRLWNKLAPITKSVEIKNKPKEKEPIGAKKKPEEVKSALESLSQVIDTYGWSSEEYKQEMAELGLNQNLNQRIKSTPQAKKELNLGKSEESEVDLFHKA